MRILGRGKFVVYILLIIVSFTFSSCNSSKNVKLGFLIHSLSNSRWKTDLVYLQQKADELGDELIIRSAEGDENLQLEQAKELLKNGAKVLIVVAVNQNIAAAIVREAHDYNVPVISYDRFIKNCDLDYLVSFQYEEVGKMMIDYAVSHKPTGNYVLLWGDATDANAQFIRKAQVKAIQPYVDNNSINIVFKGFVEDWSVENAKHSLEKTMDYSMQKIDAVIASNAPLATSSAEILSNYEMDDDVIVTGMDISINTYKLIIGGKQSMAVYKPIKQLAFTAIELANNVARGKQITNNSISMNNGRVDVPAFLLAPILVDRSNIESMIESENMFSAEELKQIKE